MTKTIQQLFEEQVEKTPDSTAVWYEGNKLTFRDLNEKANQLARKLREKGAGPDCITGILFERSLDMIIAIVSVLKAGSAYMPVAVDYPENRKKYILEDSGAKILLTQKHLAESLPLLPGVDIIAIDDDKIYGGDTSNLQEGNSPKDLAYVIYTSGTTGKPKGVMIENKSVVNLVNGLFSHIYKRYDFSLNIALLAPYTFDASIKQIFPSLLLGHTLFIVPESIRLDGKELLNYFNRNSIDIADGTPAHIGMLASYTPLLKDELAVKHFVIGGEALPAKLVKEFLDSIEERKPLVTNVYGPTECCDVSTLYTIYPKEAYSNNIIPIGSPIENVTVYILDENEKAVKEGTVGELYISGEGVGRGYLNKPQLTSERFIPDPFIKGRTMYKTGDKARILLDGNIEYLGRNDHQVKVRGFRIEPAEIESEIMDYEAVKEAVVIVREEYSGDKYLCAYYISDREIQSQELKEFLAKSLPYYMIPAYFIRMVSLPLTHNGKVDRNALPEPDIWANKVKIYTAPKNDTEERMAHIWKEVLGIGRISMEDNFFDLGGHSLKANILAFKIHKEFNIEIPIAEIFANPTVNDMIRFMQGAASRDYKSIQPVEHMDLYPLSLSQKWIFVSSRVNRGDILWNMPCLMMIDGKLDIKRFENALNMLVKRHEAFRTSFEMTERGPMQRIYDNVKLDISYIESDEDQIEGLLKEFIKPFDLNTVPLLRAGLARISEGKHAFLFDIHHIIFDGLSVNILLRELETLYDGGQLPELKIHYKDFAYWENEHYMSGGFKKQEDYWLKVFNGKIPELDLHTDFPGKQEIGNEGDRVVLSLGVDLTAHLRKFASKAGSSIYMVLLAAYNILLFKYSDQEEIVVGTLTAGRQHADLENIIGMFVRTLAMKNHPKPYKTAAEFLREVRDNSLAAFDNQEYPLNQLLDVLKLPRNLSNHPLYKVMFIMQNMDSPKFKTDGLLFRQHDINLRISACDLILEARENQEGIKLTMTYRTRLFKKETIETMVLNYLKTLELLIVNPDIKLCDFELEGLRKALDNVLDEDINFNF